MKNNFIKECLVLLEQDDIKQTFKEYIHPIIQPIVNILLKEIYPYIYLSLIFIFISFLLHLGIFILLIRNKSLF
jgi:hypothetical protein